jgi:hypothetical protein
MDYLATTDKATYGHLVANDLELLLRPTRRPVEYARRRIQPSIGKLAANPKKPQKRKFGEFVPRELNVAKLGAISKALNAPIVLSYRARDDYDFGVDQPEFVLKAVLPSVSTNLAGGSTKFGLSGPGLKPPIWVDSSQVSPEMYVLFCSKRNIRANFTTTKDVAAQVTDVLALLEKLPSWFFSNLLEYVNMAQVDLLVLAELIVAQSLLYQLGSPNKHSKGLDFRHNSNSAYSSATQVADMLYQLAR